MHKPFAAIIFCLLLQIVAVPAPAEVQSARALEIQAAFLVKFTAYVKWPAGTFSSPDAPVVIGIFGRDPFGSVIDTIARSYTTSGRHVEIRRYRDFSLLSICNMAFVAPSAIDRMNDILQAAHGKPILLVGNFPDFLDKGGMINFIRIGKRIRFDINKKNCDMVGLEISSKLLKVAHAIR